MYLLLASLSALAVDYTELNPRCTVTSVEDAGTVGSETLAVVKLTCPAHDDRCVPEEHWLAVRSDTQLVRKQLLLEACNDGYGAAGVGEDLVEVSENRFSHARSGGSAWRWVVGFALQLQPLKILETSGASYHAFAGVSSQGTWSLQDFAGTETWSMPACVKGEAPDPPQVNEVSALTLPQVALRGVDFASVELGSCSVGVDSHNAGFVVHGEPGEADDARFRALLVSDTELWVQVWDDKLVSGAKSWIQDDHLEIWVAPEPDGMWCYEESDGLKQWGVRISDGAVFSGHGEPAPLRAERLPGKDHYRLKIHLPEAPAHLSVVYSDSDDGKGQERLIATSQLSFGNPITVGKARKVNALNTVCEVRDGTLVHKDVQDPKRYAPNQAVIQGF